MIQTRKRRPGGGGVQLLGGELERPYSNTLRAAIELRADFHLGELYKLAVAADNIDGDADLEPEEDFGTDDVGDGWTWPEHRDQSHISRAATAAVPLTDDVEDDDPGGGDIVDEPHDQEHDAECEQMPGDVPCLGVYALEPDLDGKRRFLGLNSSNPAAFVGNRNKVRFA